MKDKNRSLIKEYVMKWNLHDIKRACQVNGFPAFFGIVMLFGLLSGGVSRADEEIFVNDFLTGRITRKQFWVLAEFKYPTHQPSD